MGDLAKDFSRTEFQCHCGCGLDAVDEALVRGLQSLRDALHRPVAVLSGCRCAKRNTAEGGAPRSQHVLGKAADIRVDGMTARQLYQSSLRIAQFRGFGVDDERQFVHVDVRALTARWCYHGGKETPWHEMEA